MHRKATKQASAGSRVVARVKDGGVDVGELVVGHRGRILEMLLLNLAGLGALVAQNQVHLQWGGGSVRVYKLWCGVCVRASVRVWRRVICTCRCAERWAEGG